MKLQQFISKVEEIRAVFGLYEDLRNRVAQVTAFEEVSTLEEMTDEQRAQVTSTAAELRARLDAVRTLLSNKTGTPDVDQAAERIEELSARVEQIQQLRRDYVLLRASLDLEMVMGQLPAEQRQKAEHSLGTMTARMEKSLELAQSLLPSSRLIQVLA